MFKVDDVSPPVGADQVQLKDGDRVLWYYATFGSTGGRQTLVLQEQSKEALLSRRSLPQTTRARPRAAREGQSCHADSRSDGVAPYRHRVACPSPHGGS